ncbi:cation channel sperm-associated protein 4 isoform X2 [Pongo abelii]|uniref:cation channel sperm-associated protein 4 isoform X2 n=1 Tax=Pongo abelii TaxID=9601 RepID=UPI0023E78C48|nr:cation channel sperm-associated protein 4 isoform X2 [Pongo abelii]
MRDNEKAWWQQWTSHTGLEGWGGTQEDRMGFGGAVAALRGRPSPLQSTIHESYGRPEEQVLINRQEVMNKADAWDMQEFITRMYIKQLLRHPAFQLLLALLLVINAITIALRTNSYLDQKHYELFSTIDDIVLTILICEVLLGWLNGFWIFWKVFSVFGVTLFGAFVPEHFQNIQVALYTLFICITQDGWVDIYSDFQTEKREYAMEIGGAIYFTIFITIGAFIGINLFVIVVTTNLEQMMKAGEHGQQQRITFSETGAEEEEENDQLPLVHCVVARSEKSGLLQEPLVGGPLSNLSENTCDNFCLVLEAIQENLRQYKEIRDELNMIVEEVRAIRFNQEQESEVLNRHSSTSGSLETTSSKDIRQMSQQQDLLSALSNMEKVHDSSSQILLKKHKSSH